MDSTAPVYRATPQYPLIGENYKEVVEHLSGLQETYKRISTRASELVPLCAKADETRKRNLEARRSRWFWNRANIGSSHYYVGLAFAALGTLLMAISLFLSPDERFALLVCGFGCYFCSWAAPFCIAIVDPRPITPYTIEVPLCEFCSGAFSLEKQARDLAGSSYSAAQVVYLDPDVTLLKSVERMRRSLATLEESVQSILNHQASVNKSIV